MSLTTLKLMYEKGTGTDVSLTVKGDNRIVNAHRLVLTHSSKYFKTLLSIKSEEDTHCFNNEMSFETLEAIVKYIYVGTFDDVLLTEEGIKAILRAADYLGLDVVEKLRNPLKKVLTASNVCSFYDFVLNTPLRGEINFFFLRNFSQIRLEESFLKVDVNIVDWALKDGIALLESEVEIFQTIELWINHDYVNRHQYFPRLLRNVRYVEVDEDEEGGSITIDFAMTDIRKWCICKESKNWFIHLLALMAGFNAQGPVRVAPRI